MLQINLSFKKQPKRLCKIFIQKGSSSSLPSFLKTHKIGSKYAIITDSFVEKIYGKSLIAQFKRNGIKAELITFQKGEKSKFLKTVEELAEKMVSHGFDRKDAIIALGGGVVGDIAGFLSSVYMRGIQYIQVPTTLMAMVDSSIGGKTGVDLKNGKNLIGTVHQPKAIFIDLNYLKNLPEKQIKNGLAEIIKYGVIKDKRLFKFIEQNFKKILKKDPETLKYIIEKSIKIKVKIIRKDEHDEKESSGKRIILNYGHTYGHAIERISHYRLLHGYAISIGMVIANNIAVEKGLLKQKYADRIKNLLKAAGLPVTSLKKPTKKDLLADKKKEGVYVKMVLPVRIGKVAVISEKCQ